MRINRAEGLGNAVADVVPGPRVAGGDGGIGHALGRLSQTIDSAVDDQQRQRLAEERQRALEEKQAAKEAEQARRAADRARASQVTVTAREALDAMTDQFDEDLQTGAVDKTKAVEEYRKRSAMLVESSLKEVPGDHVEAVTADLQGRVSRGEGKVQRSVTKRDRSDTLAGIDTTVEYAQRLATSDRAKGLQLGLDTIDQLGPFAGLMPDQIAKRKQAFVEGVAYTGAYTAIMTAKDNTPALRKADTEIAKDETLDPQKKATLLTTSAGFQAANAQRAEAAAARAQRQQEANLKRAEAVFNVAQALTDKGGAIDPEQAAQWAASTAGTPYQNGVRQLVQQAAETGGIAMQPISQQRAELTSIDAKIAAGGRTEALDKRRSQVERVLTASEADLKKDGLQAYVERGGGTAPALDLTNAQTIGATIAGRAQYAQRASAWAGRPVSPLFDQEAEALRDTLANLPPKQRSEAIAVAARALPAEQSAALARQLDPKDKGLSLAFAYAGTGTSEGRFTSEIIAKGQQAKRDGTSTKGEKEPEVLVAKWKATIAAQLDGVFPSQVANDNAIEAALLMAHGKAAEAGGGLSARDLRTVANLAVEGSIVEHNGRRIALPANVDQDALETRLRTITPEEVTRRAGGATTVRAGGIEVPIADFTAKLPGAELQSVGRGVYTVLVNGRPVLGTGGRPIVIPLQ